MIADSAMVLAVRLSIVIFLLGNAVGGYMLARGSHTVGAGDGGPGLPFLNWSRVAGDLRIAHFIAIHAIQIVPLFAYLLGQMTPRPALRLAPHGSVRGGGIGVVTDGRNLCSGDARSSHDSAGALIPESEDKISNRKTAKPSFRDSKRRLISRACELRSPLPH